MMDRTKILVTICVMATAALELGLAAANPTTKNPVNEELLARPVAGLQSQVMTSLGAVESAVDSAQVPGGAIVMTGCGITPEERIRVNGTTLLEVLQSIAKADPRYRWQLNHGVVNLIPKEGLPPLLRVRIGSLDVKDATKMWDASSALLGLPEVRKAEARLGLMRVGLGSIGSGGGTAPPHVKHEPVPLRLHNVSVFEALNAIIHASPGWMWIFNESFCQGRGGFNVSFSQ